MRLLISLIFVSLVAGCVSAPPRPALYPNKKLDKVGPAQGEEDVAVCMARAEAAGLKDDTSNQALKEGAGGALAGAAVGAALGAISGNAGYGAATGAVIGATGGTVHGAQSQNQPGRVYQEYVNRCLTNKGYEVIGWR